MKYHFVPRYGITLMLLLIAITSYAAFVDPQLADYELLDFIGWLAVGAGVFLFFVDIFRYDIKEGRYFIALTGHALHVILVAMGLLIAFRREPFIGDAPSIPFLAIGLFLILFLFHTFTGHHGHHREKN